MLFGPERVIACPVCEHPALVFTLRSGNTAGAVSWTDGKMSAPMLPQAPPITRCPECNRFYWVEDAQKLGELELSSGQPVPAKWAAAQPIQALNANELLLALEAGLGSDPRREQQLRILAWWAANDIRRPPAFEPKREFNTPLSPEAKANLQRLFDLLDPDDPAGRLFKAEAARELGDFSTATALLASELPSRYETAARQIRKLIEHGDRLVRVLDSGL
jgi:hypothetical protein